MWWLLFSAGGTVAAFLFPALMLVTGLTVPAGWISAEGLYALAQYPLARLLLFVAIGLPLMHAAHRVRHIVVDMNLKHLDRGVAVACYASALLAVVAAAVVLMWR